MYVPGKMSGLLSQRYSYPWDFGMDGCPQKETVRQDCHTGSSKHEPMCWWSGNLEKKEKEKEEKGEKKRIQLALHLEIYIQPFRNILTPFRKLVISKCYYLPRIDLLDEQMLLYMLNQARADMCIEWHALMRYKQRICTLNYHAHIKISFLVSQQRRQYL